MKYYIDPAGNNGDTGGAGDPWLTLTYACTQALGVGDIIHANTGLYVEVAQSVLAVGVSIEGEGPTSIIESAVGGAVLILLVSAVEGTNGNQTISYLRFDGNNFTGHSIIQVTMRSNVRIHHCEFEDFNNEGVIFNGGFSDIEPVATWATGNKFYDNDMVSCCGWVGGDGRWALGLNGQEGMLIYNNTITEVARGSGNHGYPIKGVEGYNKGVKIYNNVLTRAAYQPGTFDFCIELWNSLGGIEIYDNVMSGCIDFACDVGNHFVAPYTYTGWAHHNTIGPDALSMFEDTRGIIIEGPQNGHFLIEKNWIKNTGSGVTFSQIPSASDVHDVTIRYNIFNNIGISDAAATNSKGWGILWAPEAFHNHTVDDIEVFNNVFIGKDGTYSTFYGIQLPDIGTVTNVSIRNNIVRHFDYACVYAGQGIGDGVTIDILSIENNIFWENGFGNVPRYVNIIPTNDTTQNNIIDNPDFVTPGTDFHLQDVSPGINSGIYVGLLTDYDGNPVGNPPERGAYEFIVIVPPTPPRTTATFTYYIDGNQVYPKGDWLIEHIVHQGQLFKRRMFSGELIFGNKSFNQGLADDYDWIRYVYDDCSRIYLEIYCNEHLQHSVIPYWEGYMNYEVDFEFDEDNCILKVTPHVLDKYDCIVNLGGFDDTYFGYPIRNGTTDIIAYDLNVPANELFTTDDGETLENFIRYMILIIADCDDFTLANIVSTYFWNDDWTDGSAYSPNNYVTGATNKLNEIYVLHTDQVMVEIAGGALDGGLFDYDITFKKLTDWIRDTFQVYYYVDEEFKLRFEHVSYFRPGFTFEANTDINNEEFDLTVINYKTAKAYDYRKNKYKYLKESRVSEEQFEMVNANGQDFIGEPITYDEDCTFDFPEKKVKKFIPNFSTDLPWMITQVATPDEVNRTGYNLFHCKSEFIKNWEEQLLTGWTNAAPANDYDILTLPGGVVILQAFENAANSVWAFSNNLTKPGYVGAGSGFLTNDVLEFHAEIADLSGRPNPPTIRIWNVTGAAFVDAGGFACVYLPAVNNFTLTITAAIATDTIQIWLTNPVGNCDWDCGTGRILCNFQVNKIIVQYEVGFLTAVNTLNAHLSWANLHENYWEHERVLLEGNMNNIDHVIGVNPFLSKQFDKIQPMIPYVDCCKIVESLNYWTTDMGIGIPYKITEKKNEINVELLYE